MNRGTWRWARGTMLVLVTAGGILTLPLALPMLSPDRLEKYLARIGMVPHSSERHVAPVLPQHFADRFGWQELAATVGGVYDDLSEIDRESCAIIASNYGEAGTLDYYSTDYNLPSILCAHNSYYLWGQNRDVGDVVIVIGASREILESLFQEVIPAAEHTSTYAMPYESNITVWVCRGLKVPFNKVWRDAKTYM